MYIDLLTTLDKIYFCIYVSVKSIVTVLERGKNLFFNYMYFPMSVITFFPYVKSPSIIICQC